MSVTRPRVAVIRFPGVNCEDETRRAVVSCGMDCDILMWNCDPVELSKYDA